MCLVAVLAGSLKRGEKSESRGLRFAFLPVRCCFRSGIEFFNVRLFSRLLFRFLLVMWQQNAVYIEPLNRTRRPTDLFDDALGVNKSAMKRFPTFNVCKLQLRGLKIHNGFRCAFLQAHQHTCKFFDFLDWDFFFWLRHTSIMQKFFSKAIDQEKHWICRYQLCKQGIDYV
jgi:hypothetical protein